MKNKIWIYSIAVALIIVSYFVLKNNIKKEQKDEMNLTAVEIIVSAPNKTVNYKGNYYELMLEKSKTKINNKKYIIYKGWMEQLDIYDDYIMMSIKYWDDDRINDKTGEYDDVFYSGIKAERSNIFVVDNGNQKLATDDDVLKLEKKQYINFSALCEEETEPFGWFGQVVQAGMPPQVPINCEKIIFTSPVKSERIHFKIDHFGKNNEHEMLPAINQNMTIMKFQSIIDEEPTTKEIVPIDVIGDKEVWIKINNFDDKILEATKDISYRAKDYYLVNDYDVSGVTICSTFNEFCFVSIDKIIMNSKLKLKNNNDIGVENFQYQVYKNPRDGSIAIHSNKYDEFLLHEVGDVDINVSDYIRENDYLNQVTINWKPIYYKDITPEDSDYSIKAFGDLNCGSINDLIRNGDLSCVLKPEDFSFQIAKSIIDDNE